MRKRHFKRKARERRRLIEKEKEERVKDMRKGDREEEGERDDESEREKGLQPHEKMLKSRPLSLAWSPVSRSLQHPAVPPQSISPSRSPLRRPSVSAHTTTTSGVPVIPEKLDFGASYCATVSAQHGQSPHRRVSLAPTSPSRPFISLRSSRSLDSQQDPDCGRERGIDIPRDSIMDEGTNEWIGERIPVPPCDDGKYCTTVIRRPMNVQSLGVDEEEEEDMKDFQEPIDTSVNACCTVS